jgi:hypothetical protein
LLLKTLYPISDLTMARTFGAAVNKDNRSGMVTIGVANQGPSLLVAEISKKTVGL